MTQPSLIKLNAEQCWIIRRTDALGIAYHIMGLRWSADPYRATIYRAEVDAFDYVLHNRDRGTEYAVFGEHDIIEIVPLEGALKRAAMKLRL